jgi:hypothetical protein
MTKTVAAVAALVLVLALGASAGAAPAAAQDPEPVVPLLRAHAHNDYEHERPLLDALDHGFTSVEADVWLVDGELLVAHDLVDVRPGRTLRSLYLDPLVRRVNANRGRSVFAGTDVPVHLLVDIKSSGVATYRAIHRELRRLRHHVTSHGDWGTNERPISVTISGNRPRRYMEAQEVRYAGYDGRSSDLRTDVQPDVVPLLSDSWARNFTWTGAGQIPPAERERLRDWAGWTDEQGIRLRLWATPDVAGPEREAVWRELLDAGVEHVNTDDLAGLRDFLLENDPWAQELAEELEAR